MNKEYDPHPRKDNTGCFERLAPGAIVATLVALVACRQRGKK